MSTQESDDGFEQGRQYVERERASGASDESIRRVLQAGGWDASAIDKLWAGLDGDLADAPDPAPSRVTQPQLAAPWAREGQLDEEIIGPDGGTMVWVPAGEFMMGSPEGKGKDCEHPAHPVRITKGFWLGKCTVTNAHYWRYRHPGAEFPQGGDQSDNHPVVVVNWTEAEAYCQHYGLSLPTEAQWEYAARGPEGREYPWGNEWDPKKCCHKTNQGLKGQTFPIGSFPEGASWCGALDMAGNVWQWCKDWWSPEYYANSPDTDPPGPDTEFGRVLRGGSWLDDANNCRSADRDGDDPAYRYSYVGFRCSRTP